MVEIKVDLMDEKDKKKKKGFFDRDEDEKSDDFNLEEATFCKDTSLYGGLL